jgi:GNAT superfamily N-acetyltransferase
VHWRQAIEGEDGAIAAMVSALYEEDPSPEPLGEGHARRTLEAFRRDPVRGRAVVLEEKGNIVGYALLVSFWSNELGGEIPNVDEMYVRPAWRGRGAATDLVGRLTRGELWSSVPVAIDLEVTPENHLARALYERLGFEIAHNVGMRRRSSRVRQD